MRRLGLSLLLLAGLLCTAPVHAAAVSKDAFAANEAKLKPHLGDFFWLDAAPEASGLLAERWRLLREAAAETFRTSGGSGAAIAVALKSLAPDTEVQTENLGPDATLVAVQQGEIGEVFMVTPQGASWSMDQMAQAHPSIRDPLGAWSVEHSRDNCRDLNRSDNFGCGPIHGAVQRLPDGPAGARRFFVNGVYAQAAGATMGAQLSVWTWNGRTAPQPQKVVSYSWMADQPFTARREGDRIRIREKSDFKVLFACGGCFGRQRDHLLRLTPAGVEDLGFRSLQPDLDRVDDLLDAILHSRPAGEFATPKVIAALNRKFREERTAARKPDAFVSLGMIEGWKARGHGARRQLCLTTDDGGGQLFDLEGQGAEARVVGVRDIPGDCGKDARS